MMIQLCGIKLHLNFHFKDDDDSTLWNQVTLSGLKFTVKVLSGSPQMFPSPTNFIKGAFPLTLLSSTFDKVSQQCPLNLQPWLLKWFQNDNKQFKKRNRSLSSTTTSWKSTKVPERGVSIDRPQLVINFDKNICLNICGWTSFQHFVNFFLAFCKNLFYILWKWFALAYWQFVWRLS